MPGKCVRALVRVLQSNLEHLGAHQSCWERAKVRSRPVSLGLVWFHVVSLYFGTFGVVSVRLGTLRCVSWSFVHGHGRSWGHTRVIDSSDGVRSREISPADLRGRLRMLAFLRSVRGLRTELRCSGREHERTLGSPPLSPGGQKGELELDHRPSAPRMSATAAESSGVAVAGARLGLGSVGHVIIISWGHDDVKENLSP